MSALSRAVLALLERTRDLDQIRYASSLALLLRSTGDSVELLSSRKDAGLGAEQ